MTVGQVKQAYRDKEHTPCPITEKLIKAGYQQMSGGYIQNAKKDKDVEVDYKKAQPTQYWHLFESYFAKEHITDDTPFGKKVVCGELIFWMAEVLGCVEESELDDLCNEIINNPTSCEKEPLYKGERPIYCRKKWNKAIQDLCFDKIAAAVEKCS